MSESGSSSATWARGLLLAFVANVALCSGIVSAYLEAFPFAQTIQPAIWAIEAYNSDEGPDDAVYESDLWVESEHDFRGVVHHEEERSADGYTLYSSGHEAAARLVDASGNLLHRWEMPLEEAFPEAGASLDFFICRQAHVYRNGDLLALYMNILGKPYGSRLVRLNSDSEVQWKFNEKVHHDFAIRDDGSIYILDQQRRSPLQRPVRGVPQYPRYVNETILYLLDERGRPQKKYNLLELLAESEYAPLLQSWDEQEHNPVRGDETWDILHTNDVDILGERFTRHHDFTEPGDLLLSFRTLDLVAIMDPEAREVVWATRGYWIAQHDPDALPNGNLLVFDNRGHGGAGGFSRLIEYDPTTRAIDWSYSGSRKHPFESFILGSQEPLANGNKLVTSSKQGRIFEIDRSGEIVWEFRHPIVERWKGQPYSPTLVAAKRISPERLSFEFDRPDTD